MTTHIVFWHLKDFAEGGTKEDNARIIKQRLEALVGVVPGLRDLSVGMNANDGEYDLALVSHHDSMEALAAYTEHPEHQNVRAFVLKVIDKRAAVDF